MGIQKMKLKQDRLLGDDIESDALASIIWCDKNIFMSNIHVNKHFGPRFKSFSTMLKSSAILPYDHPDFLEKYPNGFYSENAAFIPVTMYQRMQELEPLAVKTNSLNSYWNLSSLIFIPYFIKMIERKYGIDFSSEEKTDIIFSATEYGFYEGINVLGDDQGDFAFRKQDKQFSQLIKELKNEKFEYCSTITKNFIKNTVTQIFNNQEPSFVSNDELVLLAKNNELISEKYLSTLGKDDNFIDYSLLKNKDMYEKGHPFNQLMGKVQLPSKTIDLLSLDRDNYERIIHNIPPPQNYVLFTAFENLTYKIVNDSKDEDRLIKNISGIWANLALATSDFEFKVLVDILYNNCIQKFPSEQDKNVLDRDFAFKIGHAINNNPKCGYNKRQLLINGLTQIELSNSTVRTVIFPKKIHKPKV